MQKVAGLLQSNTQSNMRHMQASVCRIGFFFFFALSPCDALMFHSNVVAKQWDTWAFVENGTWYAYYLITEHSPGEGFGCATSADGVHWTDHGYASGSNPCRDRCRACHTTSLSHRWPTADVHPFFSVQLRVARA